MGRTRCQGRCSARLLDLCWRAYAESGMRTSENSSSLGSRVNKGNERSRGLLASTPARLETRRVLTQPESPASPV
jgi:hypothetical protein